MVGKGRLELPRFAAHDPKSCSSTYFDTSPGCATTWRRGKPVGSPTYVNHNMGLPFPVPLTRRAGRTGRNYRGRFKPVMARRLADPKSTGESPPTGRERPARGRLWLTPSLGCPGCCPQDQPGPARLKDRRGLQRPGSPADLGRRPHPTHRPRLEGLPGLARRELREGRAPRGIPSGRLRLEGQLRAWRADFTGPASPARAGFTSGAREGR